MDGSVLALFDPIYDEQLTHGVSRSAGASTSARNMVKGLPSTQGVPGDASVTSNQAQLSQIVGSLEQVPPQAARIAAETSRTHSQDAMHPSQAPSARSKPNPLGFRRLPAATARRQSDRNLALRTSALPHQQHIFTARSVSLPTKLTNHDRFTHAAGRSRAAMLGAIHTNRVVSLPDAAALNNHLSGAVHSHFSPLPTVDELYPLIDLASPPRRTSVEHTICQPATVLSAQFSNQSENRPSPPSSPELSETDIVVGSPTTGRSVHFLRHSLAPSTTNTDASDHSSTVPSAAKPATVQTEAQANSSSLEPPAAKPIPALHGPPSLPYARCPSGAEGIMISEQASLPRMIWGLHEQSPAAPKTPGIRRAPLSEQQSASHAAPDPLRDAAAVDTPASTVVVTPESAKFGTIWQHPKHSYTSSAPYLKFKRSMQAGSRVGPLQSTNIDPSLLTHTDPPMKLGPPFRGKENAPLGPPFLLGSEQFETPGGYTEYHYVNEDHSNPLWREFVPTSHHDVSENATLAPHHSAVTPSLRSASLDATAYRTYDRIKTDTNSNIEEENLNNQVVDPVQKTSGLAPFGTIPSAPPQATDSRASSIHNSTDSISTPSIFAVRKTPRSQLHRPKLRDHPALAELLSNQTLHAGTDGHTGLTNPITSDIRQLSFSLGVAPEALLDSLQKLRTQKFTESAVHINDSLPFASIAAPSSNAYTPSSPLKAPPLPPGIKIPDHLLTVSPGTRASIAVSPSSTRDEKPLHPSGALRNPRSIPLARLRHKNQHKFSRTADSTDSTDSSVPFPIVNDLAADSHSSIANASSDDQGRENDAETAGAVQDVAGGRLVMGAGIQAQGPPLHSGFAAKTKKHITLVDDVRNAPKEEGSSTVSVAQANLSKRGNRGSAFTARPHPGKNPGAARSSGTRSDSNKTYNRLKKAGSRPRTKADSTNRGATAPAEPAHPTLTPSLVPAP